MYEASCSSPLPAPARQQQPPLQSEEICLFLQQLLHSSSSSCSSSSSSSSSARQTQMSFSGSGFYSSSSSSAQFRNLQMTESNQHRLLQSARVSDLEFRIRDGASTSTDDESTPGLIGSTSGIYCSPQGMKEAVGIMASVGVRDCDPVAVSIRKKQQQQAVENDLEEFDCESEEAVEASEELPKPAATRSSSKRSRAAEVHNLSEKRRRSRINEKMKALQNLIPNSNKTDKASMLDEAIEYLKQLQLQVQMLSMRNGLSLHPMYLPGVLQPPQLPQVRMGFSKGNGLPPHMNVGSGMRPMNQESSLQTSFGPSNQCATSRQPMVITSMANNSHRETTYGLDSRNRVQQGPFPLSSGAEDIFKDDILSQQQLHVNQSARNPSGGSLVENSNTVEECLLRADRSPDMFPKDLDDNQIFVQHLQSLSSSSRA